MFDVIISLLVGSSLVIEVFYSFKMVLNFVLSTRLCPVQMRMNGIEGTSPA